MKKGRPPAIIPREDKATALRGSAAGPSMRRRRGDSAIRLLPGKNLRSLSRPAGIG